MNVTWNTSNRKLNLFQTGSEREGVTYENDKKFYKLTFAEREGKDPLPEPMRLEHVSQKFKQQIWLAIEREIQSQSKSRGLVSRIFRLFNHSMQNILFRYRHEVLGLFADDARRVHWDGAWDPEADMWWFKGKIEKGEYCEVLSLIEFILRQEECPRQLHNNIKNAFNGTSIAYFVCDVNGLPTITPRSSRETEEATRQAIKSIEQSSMDGATTHLRQASEHINAQRFLDAVRESIHAVESVARMIDPKASTTLGPALDSLQQADLLKHSALKQAFQKLYGYTSDEQGIRHALLDQPSTENVGLDEALFMFGACASFAAYLVSKHHLAEQAEQQASDRQ